MKQITLIISLIALLGIIVPPCMFLADGMTLPSVKTMMLISTVVWFVAVPFWMKGGAGS